MVRTETVTVYREVLVQIPARLTRQVEVPQLPASLNTLQLGAICKTTTIRLLIANGQLVEIETLGEQP